MSIRHADPRWLDQILALNREWQHFLSPLNSDRLARLHAQSERLRVFMTGDRVDAFLLAFRENSGYDSSNYRWFEDHYQRFLYIDRVVVAGSAQGQGLGRALYDDLFRHARASSVRDIVCEFDLEPPNPASQRFHEKLGFHEVGQREYGSPSKRVSLRRLKLPLN